MATPVQPPQQQIQLAYLDRPDVVETFVDSLEKINFDGMSFRLEFVVNRFDRPQQGKPPTGNKVSACRLVLTPQGMLTLVATLNNAIKGLQQQGVIQQIPVGPGTPTMQ